MQVSPSAPGRASGSPPFREAPAAPERAFYEWASSEAAAAGAQQHPPSPWAGLPPGGAPPPPAAAPHHPAQRAQRGPHPAGSQGGGARRAPEEAWAPADAARVEALVRQHLEVLAEATGMAAACAPSYQPLMFKLWDATLQCCTALVDEEEAGGEAGEGTAAAAALAQAGGLDAPCYLVGGRLVGRCGRCAGCRGGGERAGPLGRAGCCY
jgi:hypothetical protein